MIVISESGPRLTLRDARPWNRICTPALQVIGRFQMAEPLYPPSSTEPRRSNAGDRMRIAVPSRIRRTIGFGERTSIQGVNPRGEAVSSRMAGAPAQEEIDEPADNFLRPRSDIAHLDLLA